MRTFLPLCLVLVASALPAIAQGPLTPPGAPAPVMKTLDQVEPRVPISALHTPGDATNTFVITAPGSYYLTGNFAGESGKNGIFVNADNVTIDLNGFTMTGPGSNSAITMPVPPTTPENTTLRNGSIKNWGFAVQLRSRARVENVTFLRNVFDALSTGNGSLISNCIASNNGQNGIGAGSGSIVRSSTAANNNGYGIATGDSSVIVDCNATDNAAIGMFSGAASNFQNCTAVRNNSTGIGGNNRSTIVDCTASDNGAFGIVAFDSANVQRCVASGNRGGAGIFVEERSQIIGCIADGNGTGAFGHGIRASLRAIVKHCSATQNRQDGITVAGESVVAENRASENGRGGAAAGIRTSGSGSRLEGNHVRDNTGTGILASTSDVIIRNTAGNNSVTNYNPSSGFNFGQIQQPASAANPMANVQF